MKDAPETKEARDLRRYYPGECPNCRNPAFLELAVPQCSNGKSASYEPVVGWERIPHIRPDRKDKTSF